MDVLRALTKSNAYPWLGLATVLRIAGMAATNQTALQACQVSTWCCGGKQHGTNCVQKHDRNCQTSVGTGLVLVRSLTFPLALARRGDSVTRHMGTPCVEILGFLERINFRAFTPRTLLMYSMCIVHIVIYMYIITSHVLDASRGHFRLRHLHIKWLFVLCIRD